LQPEETDIPCAGVIGSGGGSDFGHNKFRVGWTAMEKAITTKIYKVDWVWERGAALNSVCIGYGANRAPSRRCARGDSGDSALEYL
jgi:hypothetical protein